MAKTDLQKFTVKEKLNKMDVDVIEVTSASITTNATGELAILPTEIPNAVAVPGGSCIIQSITAYNPSGTDLPLTIFISNSSQAFLGGTLEVADPADVTAVGSTVDGANLNTLASDANVATILGGVQFVTAISSPEEVGNADKIYSVNSIGSPAKAAAGETSLYFWAISDGSATPSVAYTFKIGLIKD